MSVKIKLEGFSELLDGLRELPKATAKNVIKRVLLKRAEPFAATMRQLVPVATGHLKNSITVGVKLSSRQRRLQKRDGQDEMTVFAGAGPYPYSHMVEFGGEHNKPEPFARPAWDENVNAALDGLRGDMWAEIRKAADRIARKTARKAAKS